MLLVNGTFIISTKLFAFWLLKRVFHQIWEQSSTMHSKTSEPHNSPKYNIVSNSSLASSKIISTFLTIDGEIDPSWLIRDTFGQ